MKWKDKIMRLHTRINDVDCYGVLEDNSNFYIVCDDERYDGLWAEGNPNNPDHTFKTWGEVVEYLTTNYRSDITQIEAI